MIKKALFLMLPAIAFLIAGCASDEEVAKPQRPMIPIRIAGNNIPPDSMEGLRYGEDIKAYKIGRYIDPNNHNIMYEKNTMYRVEESGAWNTRPNAETRLPPREPEYRRILDSQKPIIAEFHEDVERLKQIQKGMLGRNKIVSTTADISTSNFKRLKKLELENMLLQKKLQLLNAKIEAISRSGTGIISTQTHKPKPGGPAMKKLPKTEVKEEAPAPPPRDRQYKINTNLPYTEK